MDTTKMIIICGKIKGHGIVNYDSKEQKFAHIKAHKMKNESDSDISVSLPDVPRKDDGMYSENVMYAKKNFIFDREKEEISSRLKISSNLLRHSIFGEVPHTNPIISGDKLMMTTFMLSPVGLVRGYMFTTRKDKAEDGTKENGLTYARKSALTITDAVQSDGDQAMTHFEIHNRTGVKDDTSMFYKENCGDVEYDFTGVINFKELRFFSCDPKFGRMAMDPDFSGKIAEGVLQSHFGKDVEFETGGFTDVAQTIGKRYAEYGIFFGDKTVEFLAKKTLKNIFGINIMRAGAYATLSSLKIKVVKNILKDKFDDENWISIKNAEDIDNIDFGVIEKFYEKVSDEDLMKSSELYKEFNKKHQEARNDKSSKASARRSKNNES